MKLETSLVQSYSKKYIKEKLDENDDNINKLIRENKNLTDYNKALLRGIILHNLAISKELGLISPEEYNQRYDDWQNIMNKEYWKADESVMNIFTEITKKGK